MLQKFKDTEIKKKLIAIFLLMGFVPLFLISTLNYQQASNAIEKESFNKLTSVRELKKDQIEKYFMQIRNQVLSLSENKMIVSAVKEFRPAFENILLENNVLQTEIPPIEKKVGEYYNKEFLPRLNGNLTEEKNISSYWPKEDKTIYLQYLYFANNPHPTGEKLNLNNAGDGSTYSKIHEKYHPIIKSYLEKFGYYDIFLVDINSGNIIYSVFKEVDFATSLLTGPYKNTNFAKAFKSAKNSSQKDFIALEDFATYDPSYSAPASFIASPVFDGNEKVGVLLFQMPVDEINRIMLSDEKWPEVGLGESGETYLVAEDFKLRSNSRFLIEDKEAYLTALKESNENDYILDRINSLNTSILLQSCNTDAAKDALANKSGNKIILDYRNVPVLSSYTPLEIDGLNWSLMAEIDEEEAFRASTSMLYNTTISSLLLLLVISGLGYLIAKGISSPIITIADAAKKVSEGKFNINVDINSKDETGILANAFNKMIERISTQIGYLDKVPTPIMIIDKDYTIQYLNAKGIEIIGKNKNDVIGTKCYENFKTDHCNTDKCACSQAMKFEKTFSEETISNVNEQGIPILYTGSPVRNSDGNIVGALEYIADISDIKERENYLKRSTKTMLEAMDQFAKGDLTIKVKSEKEDDDIAKLFEGFNNSVGNIKNTMSNVIELVRATVSASMQISTSADEMAAGTQEQSAQSDEVASAVEEMATTILETTGHASSATESSAQAGKFANEGGTVVQETIQGMNRIAEVVSSAAVTIKALGENSDKIGAIVQVIDDIADQTNLLALNAAIEAARAGEQGRGFAVVADEVRKLAEKTTKATKEIADMIRNIQRDTGEAVTSISQGNEEVEKGKKLASKAGESLKSIIDSSNNVSAMINQVASASEEQSVTAEQISKNIESINTVTQQTAAGVSQIAHSAENLNNLTNNLEQLISQFKLQNQFEDNVTANPEPYINIKKGYEAIKN